MYRVMSYAFFSLLSYAKSRLLPGGVNFQGIKFLGENKDASHTRITYTGEWSACIGFHNQPSIGL